MCGKELVLRFCVGYVKDILPHCHFCLQVESEDIGTLTKIRIGHDNSGFGAAWYLDKVSNEQLAFAKK